MRRSVRKRNRIISSKLKEGEENNELENRKSRIPKRLSREMHSMLQQVLSKLMKHKQSLPFLYPVDSVEVPDYYTVITKPMDFTTIQNQLEAGVYSSAEEFEEDIRQVFSNCWTYNQAGSYLCNSATILSKLFDSQFGTIKVKEKKFVEDKEILEMQSVIDQLKSEYDKLVGELNKFKSTSPIPCNLTSKVKQSKQPKKKKQKKEKKEPKTNRVITPPKINTSPIVYKYEYADKDRLSQKINTLTTDNLQKMVDVLSAEIIEFQKKDGELEIDLEQLSDASLSRLENFVDDCLKQQQRDKIILQGKDNLSSIDASNKLPDGSDSESSSASESDDDEDEDIDEKSK